MNYNQRINDDVRPSKRPRTLNETPTTTTLMFPPPTPQAISRNASASVMFFKTRLCQKFSAGFCPHGDRCTFAHGVAELRPSLPVGRSMIGGVDQRGSSGPQPPPPPPPNTTKICECQSLGACERCIFRRVTEAEVAYVGLHHHRHHPHMDRNGPFSGPRNGPTPIDRQPCYRWQNAGQCKYGNRCIYSHQTAVAAMQRSGDRVELNSASGGVAPLRPIREAAHEPETEFQFESELESVQGSGFQKLLRREKIAGIYGDLMDEDS